ncbi:hypothetical protein JI664_17105 [Rhodobacter sp. NTK016B]|uniref:hypothetical protein n=1 Tax=Rhodobacter sp. NTK016B TaxID=2759676 RepID=UPI001A8E54DF|nr:hypothetical protein [Rhodobacter sp. NTK016B]MBN8293693.1 hypothetical protein [Rhodobacter sp. NTK016B]
MKKTLVLLVGSTVLTAAIGVPAWSAMYAPADGSIRPFPALLEEGEQTMPLVLASDDDDEDRRLRDGSRRGHDDDDDDGDDDCRGSASDPAPAGTVAPPQNGLFGNGAPPRVQVN